jgi:hypothetical protein
MISWAMQPARMAQIRRDPPSEVVSVSPRRDFRPTASSGHSRPFAHSPIRRFAVSPFRRFALSRLMPGDDRHGASTPDHFQVRKTRLMQKMQLGAHVEVAVFS